MKKIRCANCNKVLMEGEIKDGKIAKDCPGCGEKNLITSTGVIIEPKNTKPFQQRLKLERK